MKQKFLLSCGLLGCILTQAQFVDPTTYRGAFAPAPAKQWIDNWTNFDPDGTSYPTTTVTVTGNITSNTMWTKNNTYLLDGLVYVQNGATLTIEAGTVIRGVKKIFDAQNPNPSTLIITRGSKLIAEGTECNPIVFTSNEDMGSRERGDWGGIIMLGNAQHNLGGAYIEGLPTNDTRNFHGNTLANAINDENSGSLKYVRIEFAGFYYTPANEINGLTMGSIGSGTTIDYVQVSFNDDDAFEWFGGTVNAKHLVAYRCADDDFDTDNGYSGTVQYGLGIKDPAIVGALSNDQSNGFESNTNTPPSGGTSMPFVKPYSYNNFYNMTMVGPFRCGILASAVDAKHQRGAHVRQNTHQSIYNSIFLGYRSGLHIDNNETLDNIDTDSSRFRNNLIANDYSTFTSTVASFNAATRTRFQNAAYGNDSVNYSTGCDLLVNPFPSNYLNPDFRPNTGFVDPVSGSAVFNSAPDLYLAFNLGTPSFNQGDVSDFGIEVGENGFATASGTITVTIPKVSGFTYEVNGLTLSVTPQLGSVSSTNGSPNNNDNWLFSDDGTNIVCTLKAGAVIPKNSFPGSVIGLKITRNIGSGSGFAVQTADLSFAGDFDISNNGTSQILTSN